MRRIVPVEGFYNSFQIGFMIVFNDQDYMRRKKSRV